jgi:hypothetical protein
MQITLRKLYEAVVIENYRKEHPELKWATIIRYHPKTDILPTVILTVDDAEIRKFQAIGERHFHPKKKEFPDLRINRVKFKDSEESKTYISSLTHCLP